MAEDLTKLLDFSSKSWAEVEPVKYKFIKKSLNHNSKEKIEGILKKPVKVKLDVFDPLMINEAVEFLRLSIINLLAYKTLVCGNYLAWGKVTVYYSNFYAMNSLLRLKRFTLVHLEYPDFSEEKKTVKTFGARIYKPKNNRYYLMEVTDRVSRSGHKEIAHKFAELYPELFNSRTQLGKEIGDISIKERTDWNYDLFYASQSTDKFVLQEAADRCRYNFLDPEFGASASSEDEAQQYFDLQTSIGIDEAGTGQYQQCAIYCLKEIAKVSKFKKWYLDEFNDLLRTLSIFQSSEPMKREIAKWLESAIRTIETDDS
jgi:hypothetical protein